MTLSIFQFSVSENPLKAKFFSKDFDGLIVFSFNKVLFLFIADIML